MDETKKKISFQYKLIEARKISYFERDIEKCTFKDKINKSNVPFQLQLNVVIDDSEGTLELKLETQFYYIEDSRKEELFGVHTSHKFKIKNFPEVFPAYEKKEYNIPDKLMATFLDIAVSGTRGMLIVLNTNKYFGEILLPLIDPLHIIKKGKNDKRE